MITFSTIGFLNDLRENNNRDWFKSNKNQYDDAKSNVEETVQILITELSGIDPLMSGLEAKECIKRIYRDIRFSKDKIPYKNNFGIILSPNGRKVNDPCYYLHIEPRQCFVAGGYRIPSSDHLKAIRQEIDYHFSEFIAIIEGAEFKKTFGNLDWEQKLKTAPKGHEKDHPGIEYLKLKSFTASVPLSDAILCSKEAIHTVIDRWKLLFPLNAFLRRAVDK